MSFEFRYFGPSSKPETPQISSGTSPNGTPLPEAFRNAVALPTAQPIEPPVTVPEPVDENEIGSGLHEVVKSTDSWFNSELSQLEKFAVAQGVEWAKAGIPRQDAPFKGELPIEATLKARASEILQEWIARTKRKVQDSIQAAYAEAAERIVQFRHAFTQLERNTVEIDATERSIRDREEGLRTQQKTFGAPALLPKWLYWVIFPSVAIIDWIANVPIFTELLPAEFGSREIWRHLAVNAQKSGAWGGVKMLGARLLFHLDVSIFALGVVLFLMAMAHFAGSSLRRWLVLNPQDEPLLAPTLKTHRRQTYAPFVFAVLGMVLAVCFLYGARRKLVEATTIGMAQAQQEVEDAERKAMAAKGPGGDLSTVPELQQRLNEMKSKRDDWRERDRFAKDIGMMNTPILLLNIVLALTAMTAAYCVTEPKVTEGRLVDPVIPELKSKLASLRLNLVNQRQSLRTLDSDIQAAISRARYLAGTRPLAEWEAKARRLNAVVTLFRGENARARGVDPESIIAFRQRPTMQFPTVPKDAFQTPVELAALEVEFRNLRNELQRHTAGQAQPIATGAGA
jgi:hypothetical protein